MLAATLLAITSPMSARAGIAAQAFRIAAGKPADGAFLFGKPLLYRCAHGRKRFAQFRKYRFARRVCKRQLAAQHDLADGERFRAAERDQVHPFGKQGTLLFRISYRKYLRRLRAPFKDQLPRALEHGRVGFNDHAGIGPARLAEHAHECNVDLFPRKGCS